MASPSVGPAQWPATSPPNPDTIPNRSRSTPTFSPKPSHTTLSSPSGLPPAGAPHLPPRKPTTHVRRIASTHFAATPTTPDTTTLHHRTDRIRLPASASPLSRARLPHATGIRSGCSPFENAVRRRHRLRQTIRTPAPCHPHRIPGHGRTSICGVPPSANPAKRRRP